MTIKCKKCNRYSDFGSRGDKLKEMRCSCSGEYEKVHHVGNGIYKNFTGDLYELQPPWFIEVLKV